MNKYICIANLTKDVELRYTPTGKAVANLNLAINTGYGERKETIFITATAWDKTAESCNNYLSNGKKVAVEGQLKEQKWQDKETGKERSKIILNINQIEFLSPVEEGKNNQKNEVQEEASNIDEEIINPCEDSF
jgi:single-strand DNA-binding protein